MHLEIERLAFNKGLTRSDQVRMLIRKGTAAIPKIGTRKKWNSFFSHQRHALSASFDIFVVTYRVTNFLPKLVNMLLFSAEKNWISIFWNPLFLGIAGRATKPERSNQTFAWGSWQTGCDASKEVFFNNANMYAHQECVATQFQDVVSMLLCCGKLKCNLQRTSSLRRNGSGVSTPWFTYTLTSSLLPRSAVSRDIYFLHQILGNLPFMKRLCKTRRTFMTDVATWNQWHQLASRTWLEKDFTMLVKKSLEQIKSCPFSRIHTWEKMYPQRQFLSRRLWTD